MLIQEMSNQVKGMSCQEMSSHEVSGQERSGNYEVMKCKVQGRFFKLFQILWIDLLPLLAPSGILS